MLELASGTTEQLLQRALLLDLFNQYNTDFFKCDAHQWRDDGAYLIRPLERRLEFVPLDAPADDAPPDSLSNKSFTDVTFIVGPPQHSKKYVGHRVLLAMTSPVFETMFYGDMADKNKYIRIPDVAPIGFENLLRYAYTDSLKLSSVEDAMLTAYAAKKYLLPQLLRECLTFIELNIGPASACVVFEFAHVLNSQQLVLQAMNLIDRQTAGVLESATFRHVQASTVEFVANRRYLSLRAEQQLFAALLGWAQAEAERRHLDQDDWPQVRAILLEVSALGAIRFLAMTAEEFARAVARSSRCVALEARAETNGESAAEEPLRQVDVEDASALLTGAEQRAILLNLALPGSAKLPPTLSAATESRQPPPEYFSLRRFRGASLATSTTSTRNLKTISSKFQCLSENVFVVALTIPIRLDAASYANRTPKFECHLKFSTRAPSSSGTKSPVQPQASEPSEQSAAASQQLMMDTIDESLHISIARDKDCLVRLKRPILVRMGNINELQLTFQSYALDEDIVALRTPKLRAANFSEQTDAENIGWLFFRSPNVEFSEIHYYY